MVTPMNYHPDDSFFLGPFISLKRNLSKWLKADRQLSWAAQRDSTTFRIRLRMIAHVRPSAWWRRRWWYAVCNLCTASEEKELYFTIHNCYCKRSRTKIIFLRSGRINGDWRRWRLRRSVSSSDARTNACGSWTCQNLIYFFTLSLFFLLKSNKTQQNGKMCPVPSWSRSLHLREEEKCDDAFVPVL